MARHARYLAAATVLVVLPPAGALGLHQRAGSRHEPVHARYRPTAEVMGATTVLTGQQALWLSAAVYAARYAASVAASARSAPPRGAPSHPVARRAQRATQGVSAGGSPGGFLACVRHRESRGNYQAVNPSSGTGGAYQFMPTTWRNAAREIGVNVGAYPRAELAPPSVQDAVALHTLATQGTRPWAGGSYRC